MGPRQIQPWKSSGSKLFAARRGPMPKPAIVPKMFKKGGSGPKKIK